jgi:hypothetical protein
MTLPDLLKARKAIAQFPGWSEPEPETGFIWFHAPLEVAGVVEEGFILAGGCFRNIPECNVTFELRIAGPKRRRIPLARFEWQSLRGGHTNARRGGSPVSGTRVSDTHYHSFDLNWLHREGRMRLGNLPQAEDFEQPIQSFESLRQTIGNLFRINNIEIVNAPPWEYSLFDNG